MRQTEKIKIQPWLVGPTHNYLTKQVSLSMKYKPERVYYESDISRSMSN